MSRMREPSGPAVSRENAKGRKREGNREEGRPDDALSPHLFAFSPGGFPLAGHFVQERRSFSSVREPGASEQAGLRGGTERAGLVAAEAEVSGELVRK